MDIMEFTQRNGSVNIRLSEYFLGFYDEVKA